MSLVQSFDPPAFLSDFEGIAGQAEAVFGWFEDSISVPRIYTIYVVLALRNAKIAKRTPLCPVS